MTIDTKAFRDFEYEGWQKVANRYHDTFAGVTVQAITPLLDAAEVGKGVRVLDLACGPGYAAGAAHERGGNVLGVDFSSEMIAEARRHYPGVEFQVGDAEALTLENEAFDAVIMNFGMLHVGRPELAIAEAHRMLRPGGRFAFTVWDKPEKAVGFEIVLNAIRKHGDMYAPIPSGPPFFRFSDPWESARVLHEAGFPAGTAMIVPQIWRLPTADSLFDIMMNASVRNAALLRAQPPEVLDAIRLEMRAAVEVHAKGDSFELPMPAVLTFAQKIVL